MPGRDERDALADSVRRFLTDAGLPRKGYGEPPDSSLWRGLADLGVVAALAPESADGLGLSLADLADVLRQLGRACFPGPFVSTAVGAVSLLTDISDTELLPRVVSGETIAVVVDDLTTATPDAAAADVLLSVTGDEVVLVEDFTATAYDTVDGSRSFATVQVNADGRRIAAGVAAAIAAARDRMLAAWTADGVGAAQAAFDLAMEHAHTRQQFGVPIGSFQSVQHLLVDAYATLEAGRLAVEHALSLAEGEPAERHRAATMAGAWCCDGLLEVATAAIGVLGGIGFTWEHDAHLYYKRLLSLQTTYGGTPVHLEELASRTLD